MKPNEPNKKLHLTRENIKDLKVRSNIMTGIASLASASTNLSGPSKPSHGSSCHSV
jgi:hypothetical protein